jgi:hypothetical protein
MGILPPKLLPQLPKLPPLAPGLTPDSAMLPPGLRAIFDSKPNSLLEKLSLGVQAPKDGFFGSDFQALLKRETVLSKMSFAPPPLAPLAPPPRSPQIIYSHEYTRIDIDTIRVTITMQCGGKVIHVESETVDLRELNWVS